MQKSSGDASGRRNGAHSERPLQFGTKPAQLFSENAVKLAPIL